MEKEIWGTLVLLTAASPFIALIIIVIVKTRSAIRKRKQAKASSQGTEVVGGHQGHLTDRVVATQSKKDAAKSIPFAERHPILARIRNVVLFPGAVLLAFFGSSVAGITAAAIGSLFYVAVIFPVVLGFVGGFLLTAAIQMATIRNKSQMIFIALVISTTMYGMYHYGRYFALQVQASLEIFPTLTQATNEKNLKVAKIIIDDALEDETGYSGFPGYMLFKAKEGVSIGRFYSSSRLNLGPTLTWMYWILEFGIILWLTMVIGRKEMLVPVCDACGNTYGREKHLGGVVGQKESLLLDLVRRKDFAELGTILEENADVPSVELYLQSCEKCQKGTSHLFVRRAFRNTTGRLEFSDATQATLQPRESASLSEQLA